MSALQDFFVITNEGTSEEAQNAAQQTIEDACTESQIDTKTVNFDKKQDLANHCKVLVGRVGVEPT